MTGMCWKCQILYHLMLVCLFIFMPAHFPLFLFPLLLFHPVKPSFSPLCDCYTPKQYWRCFKCDSKHRPHYFHVCIDVVCTHHSEGKMSFLFGLCLAIVSLPLLKAFRRSIKIVLLLSQGQSSAMPS